jgi:hypothetical protein
MYPDYSVTYVSDYTLNHYFGALYILHNIPLRLEAPISRLKGGSSFVRILILDCAQGCKSAALSSGNHQA